MNTILITGGSGFIGSNFIHYMLKKYKNVEIINLDKLTYAGNPNNLLDVENDERYKFIKGDICNKEQVKNVIMKHEITQIINFAAESHVDRSITGPDDFIQTDVFGTFTLLETCRKFDIDKYIQISTDEVYGSIKNGSFKEKDSLNPSSPYSSTKASADLLVKSYHITYDLPILITRSSNNFGPFQYPEKLIPLFITNAISNKPLPLYGNGLNVRDWLYVEDNCVAIDLVRKKGKIGSIYNIGANNEKTNIEITNIILEQLNKPKSLIQYVKDRPGHDWRYSIDSEKIIGELGWKPTKSLDFINSMKETIQWYEKNVWWWMSEDIRKGL
ncbi:MAG: dTDP-glucose 4,6-dehydratase [Halobacteriota archaeon]|nr:dTDP-glucose 4,6-dehydratase [Halobacteriota archaeon]